MSFLKYLPTFWTQTYPPKPKFSVDQIPDLTNRVCIVTGGSSGIGYETAKALLDHNAKVYIAARNTTQIQTAIDSLKEATGKEAISLELDLSSLASVRRAAKEFLSKEKELHVLFNNAGVMAPPVELTTADGYDLQFGTNVVGPFYFTELLMPALFAGKETSSDSHARIITTSSFGAFLSGLHWDTFVDGPPRVKLGTKRLYLQSKNANVVIARQIAQRYGDKGILSMSCNPGNLKSNLQRHVSGFELWVLKTFLLYPTSYGALTQLWGGVMPEAIQHNGQFLIPWARAARGPDDTYDPETGARLWTWLEEEVAKFEKKQEV
ncbi:hypothetical protein EUX98_g2596 [Antrodiella citrinella]|uniref:NAD(P)-binding protein n=1 Tax=Antrodiella citrinella TaxID=2447956 RepID=A0A4S4N1K5_9APHY|nr:hypothetical protein EUX98_g2596 [Antrodiella citrinella]